MDDDLLFEDASSSRAPLPLLPNCSKCGLFKDCNSPKMECDGEGRKKIAIVGEAPGKNEDREGRPFVGQSGDMVWAELRRWGIKRKDCWIMNAARCRPDRNKLPPAAINHCRPFTVRDIEDKGPRVIILLGDAAVRCVIGWLWKDGDVGGIRRWAGQQIPCQQLNAWICPTWHPASFLHGEDEDRNDEVRKMLWQVHLKDAVKLRDCRPWQKVPDWESTIREVLDCDEAAKLVRGYIGEATIAWDWESTGLKPFNRNLELYSCAMSDGETAISYPWHGEAIRATEEFLESDTPKIGFNIKHEQVWALQRMGIRVRNWVGDAMLDSHILDNRPNVSSLDYQAFATLGFGGFKSFTEKYLKTKGNHAPNRIREMSLPQLLRRGGLDALLEFKLWQKQREKFPSSES